MRDFNTQDIKTWTDLVRAIYGWPVPAEMVDDHVVGIASHIRWLSNRVKDFESSKAYQHLDRRNKALARKLKSVRQAAILFKRGSAFDKLTYNFDKDRENRNLILKIRELEREIEKLKAQCQNPPGVADGHQAGQDTPT